MDDDRRPDDAEPRSVEPSPSGETSSEAPALDNAPAVPAQSDEASVAGDPMTSDAPGEPAPPPSAPIVDWSPPPPDATTAWSYAVPPGWSGLDVRGLFARTIDTFLAHWPTFVALSIPVAVLALLAFVGPVVVPSTGDRQSNLLGLLFAPIGIYIATAMAIAADDARAGRPLSTIAILGRAVLPAVIAIISAIVVFLIIVALAIVPIVVIGIAAGDFVSNPAAPSFSVSLILPGILGLVFLGVILYVLFRLAFAPIAIAIDGAGPISALTRSWRLMKGNIWRLGVLVVAVGLFAAPWSIAGTLFVFGDRVAAGVLVTVVGTLAFGAISTIVVTLAYGDVAGRPRADISQPRGAEPVPVPDGAATAFDRAIAEAGTQLGAQAALGANPPTEAQLASIEAEADAPQLDAWSAAPFQPAADVAGEPAAASAEVSSSPGGPASPGRVSPGVRRLYVLGIFVVGLILLVPSIAAAAPALGKFAIAGVPAEDRGKIIAGTQRNAADPCAPLGRATTFSSTDQIYIGGYFTRGVLPGQSATIHVLVNDEERVAAPIKASGRIVGCYYELQALTGLGPAEYHLLIDDSQGVLAEGRFTVK
jgi:hypothetical protein